jgi:hypothetical protein
VIDLGGQVWTSNKVPVGSYWRFCLGGKAEALKDSNGSEQRPPILRRKVQVATAWEKGPARWAEVTSSLQLSN